MLPKLIWLALLALLLAFATRGVVDGFRAWRSPAQRSGRVILSALEHASACGLLVVLRFLWPIMAG